MRAQRIQHRDIRPPPCADPGYTGLAFPNPGHRVSHLRRRFSGPQAWGSGTPCDWPTSADIRSQPCVSELSFGDDAPQGTVSYALTLVQLRKVSTKLCANTLAVERRAAVHRGDEFWPQEL